MFFQVNIILQLNLPDDKILEKEDAIKENERITFENNNIKGSISLKGVTIDDLTFKKYTETLNGKDKIILLHPKKIDKGYYVETGWATNSNIEVPNSKTIWTIKGNNKLGPNNPVIFKWTNNQGIIFEKKISIDQQYLFTINQKIINNSKKRLRQHL